MSEHEKVVQGAQVPGIKPELPPKEDSGFEARALKVVPGYQSKRVIKDKWYTCYNLQKRKQNGDIITFYIKSEQDEFLFCIETGCAVLGGQHKNGDEVSYAAWEIREKHDVPKDK